MNGPLGARKHFLVSSDGCFSITQKKRVLAGENGGRWSDETKAFVSQLAKAR